MGVFGNGYTNIRRIDPIVEATVELENELINFNRLFNAIEVMNENSIILEFSFKDVIEKIKELWHRFTEFVKRIWNKIFHKNKTTSKSIEDAQKNTETVKQLVQNTTPEQVKKKDNTEEKSEYNTSTKNTEPAPTAKIVTTSVDGSKKEVEVKAKISKEEKLEDFVLREFYFDIVPTVEDSLKELKDFDPKYIFGFLGIIDHDASYNITMKDDKDDMNNQHIDHVSDTDYALKEFKWTEVIGRAQIKEKERNYTGTWTDISTNYSTKYVFPTTKKYQNAILEYGKYIDEINKLTKEVQDILSSGDENIKKYIKDNFKAINKGKQSDEEIDKFVERLLPKVATIISKDVARGQKVIDIITKASVNCERLINKYIEENGKLIGVAVKFETK